MKKIIAFITLVLLSTPIFVAQSIPQLINYQAVAHNSNGGPLANQSVSATVIIRSGGATGPIVYQEAHAVTTNQFGLFYYQIGNGSIVSGTFSAINWGAQPHFLNTIVNGDDLGTVQLISVPYALASQSTRGINNIPVSTTTPSNGNVLVFNGVSGQWESQAPSGVAGSNSILTSIVETPGANCLNGGYQMQYGTDDNNNSILDAGEIDGSYFICNGNDGATGPAGATGATGPAGTNGTNGISLVWLGSLASAPGSPNLNEAYYNTTSGQSFVWDGSAWQTVAQDGAVGPAGATGATGPAGATGATGPAGTNGTNGISITWLGSLAAAPATPNLNEAYYNTTSGQSFVWDGSAWQTVAQDGATGAAGTNGTNGTNGISITWLGSLAAAPATPNLNEAYYNTTSGQSFVWDGSAWQTVAQDGATGAAGTNGTNGTNGISITWLGSLAAAPATPNLNEAYYNTTSGQSFVWDGSAWQTVAQDGVINVTGSSIGDVLVWDGTNWVSGVDQVNDADSDPLNEIELPTTANIGDVLVFDGTNWVAGIDGDTDAFNEIELPSAANLGDVLVWNGSSWSAGPDMFTDADSDPLNEIELPTSATIGEALVWNGSAWAPTMINVNDADNDPLNEIELPTSATIGEALIWNGSAWVPTVINVNDADNDPLNEIELPTTATIGEALVWNGSAWVPNAINVNDADSDPSNEIELPTSATTNDVLTWDGSAWVASASTSQNIYNTDGTVTAPRIVTQGANSITYKTSGIGTVLANFEHSGFSGGVINIDHATTQSTTLNFRNNTSTTPVTLGSITGGSGGLRLDGGTGGRVAVGHSASLGKFAVQHAATQASPTINLQQTDLNLNRIHFRNSPVASKFWEIAAETDASDASSGYSINYFNGTTYNIHLLTYGNGKTAINGSGFVPVANSSMFDVFGTSSFHDSVTIRTTSGDPYTLPMADGPANYIIQTNGAGVLTWVDPSSFGGNTSRINDIDNDTYIETEQSPDEDLIRIGLGGTEKWVITNQQLIPSGYGQSVHIGNGAGNNANLVSNPRNVFIGELSGNATSSGTFNTAVGGRSFENNTTGFYNTAMGNSSMEFNITGTHNTAIGHASLLNNTAGISNTAIGTQSLVNSVGNNNVGLGYGSGTSLNAGNDNTFIGYNTSAGVSPITNATAIGANAVVSQSNSLILGNNTNVGIGISSPMTKLHVAENSNSVILNQVASNVSNIQSGIIMGRSRGTVAVPTPIQSGDSFGEFGFIGYDGTGFNQPSAGIRAEATENFSSTNTGAKLLFSTTPNGSNSGNERMVIENDGSVGINTTTPSATLDVVGTFQYQNASAVSGYVLTSTDGLGNATWQPAPGGGTRLNDTDNDTYIEVEQAADEDIIRFYDGGVEYFTMNNGRIDVLNTNNSTFMGRNSGLVSTGTNNTGYGFQTLQANTSGQQNTTLGGNAMLANTTGSFNVALGNQALQNGTGTANNVAVGYRTLLSNTSSNIVAVGYTALQNNTTGFQNTAIGYRALFSNSTGSDNTALGYNSGNSMVSSFRMTAIGSNALSNNTSNDNTAIGANALNANTTAANNTAVGSNALSAVTTGGNNTAVGYNSMLFTTGFQSTAVGASSLQANTTGSNNNAFGLNALGTNTTGGSNSAFGNLSLQNNIAGGNNSAFGNQSLLNTTGSNNTAIGYDAGITNASGANNTFLGYNANPTVATLTNASAIGYNATVGQSNAMILGDGTINVGIGTSTPNSTLSTVGSHSVNIVTSALATITLTNTDYVLVKTGAGATVVNLPQASTCSGRVYKIAKSASTGVLTIDAFGSELVDGAITLVLNSAVSVGVEIISNGAQWYVISKF